MPPRGFRTARRSAEGLLRRLGTGGTATSVGTSSNSCAISLKLVPE
jgi:hypothetical protein